MVSSMTYHRAEWMSSQSVEEDTSEQAVQRHDEQIVAEEQDHRKLIEELVLSTKEDKPDVANMLDTGILETKQI